MYPYHGIVWSGKRECNECLVPIEKLEDPGGNLQLTVTTLYQTNNTYGALCIDAWMCVSKELGWFHYVWDLLQKISLLPFLESHSIVLSFTL